VTASAFILSNLFSAGLPVCCSIGFCAGTFLFFYGFRLLQRRLTLDTPVSKIGRASMWNDGEGLHVHSPSQSIAVPSEAMQPQVIRLSPDSGPTKTAEMTQQQKVAAALVKAGISNPAAWSGAEVTEGEAVSGVQAITDPEV